MAAEQFDVIVVGAGSAGCAVPARLSADPNRQVLLVESGPDYPPPDSWPPEILHGSSLHAANYLTLFDAQYSEGESLIFVMRGRVVGGSSAVNGGMFFRGPKRDYDLWEAPGWSGDEVEPLFKRSEADLDFPDSTIHGSAGPIPVRRALEANWLPHIQAFHDAALRSGCTHRDDLAEWSGDGVGPIPMNIVDGRRVSAAMGYIDPIRGRPNLSIWPECLVTRIVFEGARAREIEAVQRRQAVRAEADTIVVSAGGLATPNLLVLSGVGPVDTLRRLAIPVIRDCPGVGQNLKDHPIAMVSAAAPPRLQPKETDPLFQVALEASSPYGSEPHDIRVFASFIFEENLQYYCALQVPSSVGHLEFRSPDPTVGPRVHFRYLEDESDRVRLRFAVRLVLDLLDQPSLAEVGRHRLEPTDDADLASVP